jgi:hypothetical protein
MGGIGTSPTTRSPEPYYGVQSRETSRDALDVALTEGEQLKALARSPRISPHGNIAFRTDRNDLRDDPGPEVQNGR